MSPVAKLTASALPCADSAPGSDRAPGSTAFVVRTLSPRKRKYDERIAAETIRTQVGEALRRLADLGFVDMVDEAHFPPANLPADSSGTAYRVSSSCFF